MATVRTESEAIGFRPKSVHNPATTNHTARRIQCRDRSIPSCNHQIPGFYITGPSIMQVVYQLVRPTKQSLIIDKTARTHEFDVRHMGIDVRHNGQIIAMCCLRWGKEGTNELMYIAFNMVVDGTKTYDLLPGSNFIGGAKPGLVFQFGSIYLLLWAAARIELKRTDKIHGWNTGGRRCGGSAPKCVGKGMGPATLIYRAGKHVCATHKVPEIHQVVSIGQDVRQFSGRRGSRWQHWRTLGTAGRVGRAAGEPDFSALTPSALTQEYQTERNAKMPGITTEMPSQPSVPQIRFTNILTALTAAVATFEMVSSGVKAPFLETISKTTRSLLTVVQSMKKNTEDCTRMLEQIHELLYAIIHLHISSDLNGESAPNMLDNLVHYKKSTPSLKRSKKQAGLRNSSVKLK
ncbi:hypothetical protein DFH09DRAFT_1110643 [Mycena vulgaris]|nr:hypothetical protein DFH09DRAFT_1110643 [Mycena vulgaris]